MTAASKPLTPRSVTATFPGAIPEEQGAHYPAGSHIEGTTFRGERPLFGARELTVTHCTFSEGESPLKESTNIHLKSATFAAKYPLWYCRDIRVSHSRWQETGRAGVWYSDQVTVTDSDLLAPKNFRRCRDLTLSRVTIPHAEETLWYCSGVQLSDIRAQGDYFAMNSSDMRIGGLNLCGNYSFDGVRNAELDGCYLESKDAFWNSENVTVRNSTIIGEYIGWNARNLTFENCEISSLQGLCYVQGLTLKNCRLAGTTLAFEYSDVDGEIADVLASIINPAKGRITAPGIEELILTPSAVDPEATAYTLA